MLPTSAHDSTTAAILAAAEASAAARAGDAIVLADDFGDQLDAASDEYLVARLRRRAGQLWLRNARSSTADMVPVMEHLADAVDRTAQAHGFSGVVRVDRNTAVEVAAAYGWANRAYGIATTVDTQFGIASATKGFAALAVMTLIEDGVLDLSTPARSVLGADLPL